MNQRTRATTRPQQNRRKRGWTIFVCLISSFNATASGLSITTFNVLAPVHRSVMPDTLSSDYTDFRESDCESWWRPRAKNVARYVAEELFSSDLIVLQEWWNNDEYAKVFDEYTGHLFGRVSHRRPRLAKGQKKREDGMAVLVNQGGRLELVSAKQIDTSPGRIAQIIHCREKNSGRSLFIGNVHLSFPGETDAARNARKQAYEVHLVARALAREGRKYAYYGDDGSHLQIIAGDFNSNSQALASKSLEKPPYHYCNCMGAKAFQSMTSSLGGEIDMGVTHRTHRGEDVSVDHVFARIVQSNGGKDGTGNAMLRLGYLDTAGTKIVDCTKKTFSLESKEKISDHRPVTAKIDWNLKDKATKGLALNISDISSANNSEDNDDILHLLKSPWNS